jgi:hypothetical protein
MIERRSSVVDHGTWPGIEQREMRMDISGLLEGPTMWSIPPAIELVCNYLFLHTSTRLNYQTGPFEVESTLKLHPAVIESAVVATPDSTRSEVVKAFIVLTSEYAKKTKLQAEIDALTKEIQEFCKKNASPYKYPRKIQFVDVSFLPKTISGKIKRAELKALEWSKAKKAKLWFNWKNKIFVIEPVLATACADEILLGNGCS